MKFNKFFMGVLGAMAFTACSSDEPINNPGNAPDGESGTNYVSISIEMASAAGGRAVGNGRENYDQGTEEESKIDNIVFFFFDKDDKRIEIKKFDNPEFSKPLAPSTSPYISNYGIIEVPLQAALSYSKVAVALNSPSTDQDLYYVTTHETLESRTKDYVDAINSDGSGQVMSNSVYFEMADAMTKPTNNKKVCLVPITPDHIYSSAERAKIDDLIKEGKKEVVSIFVERVASRVDVTEAKFDMTKYYTYKDIKEDGTEEELKTIPLYDPLVTGSVPVEITVRPVIKGMCLNVLTPEAQLMKPMVASFGGYDSKATGADAWKAFQWNDPANKRSYWASTTFLDRTKLRYYSWNYAVGQGSAAFTQYINPNTQDYEPTAANIGSSSNSKVMVVAELHQYVGNDDKGTIDLVRYGAEHMLASSLLTYAANRVNVAVRAIDWTKLGFDATESQLNNIIRGVNNAFETGFTAAAFDYALSNDNANPNAPGTEDWEAKIIKSAKFALPTIEEIDENFKESVENQITQVVNATLTSINGPEILYWKDGRTYYFTNIRHQGFHGLAGTANDDETKDYLFGVVRNHIYKVNLNGIYGLGTPVIDPAKPIDPDRPDDGRPSYIMAEINILPWRVVTNNATLH